ncbi:transposase domain-containing protein [Streptomyces sp. NPDC054765]
MCHRPAAVRQLRRQTRGAERAVGGTGPAVRRACPPRGAHRGITPELVDEVMEHSGHTQCRRRLLPARMMVYFVLALPYSSAGAAPSGPRAHRVSSLSDCGWSPGTARPWMCPTLWRTPPSSATPGRTETRTRRTPRGHARDPGRSPAGAP